MLIYIRHADDHDDDSEHRHDRHITGRGQKQARKLGRKLIEKHGHPTAIYASPFQRVLQTIEALSENLTRPVIVHQDPRIARHFSKKQQLDPDVSRATAQAEIPIVEDKEGFRVRVLEHIEDMRRAGHHLSPEVIWCVTHKAVVRQVGKQFDVDTPKEIDFLDYVVVGP